VRIVVPVTTHSGAGGWLVYSPEGALVALIQRQPSPPVKLASIIGPHVLTEVMLTLTSHQWTRLVAYVPGGEGLC
jgi:hypothetical protein